MIKINLLPSYILERARIRRAIGWVVALLVIELLAFGFAALRIRSAVTAEEERLAYWTAEAQKVAAVQALTSKIAKDTAPYERWVRWFTGLEQHNDRLASYLQELATYIYKRVRITSLSVDNTKKQVTLTGRTDSLESLADYYLNALRGPFTNVALSTTVSGWNLAGAPPLAPQLGPGGEPWEHHLTLPVTLTCTMQKAVLPPGAPAAAKALIGKGAPRPGPAPTGDDDDDDDDDDDE